MTMTKQNVVVPEMATAGVSVAAAVSYPPPRGGGAAGMAAIKKKYVTAQMELSGTTARISGWVESMKASSPTHAKAAAALAAAGPSLSFEDYSASWISRHPSALSKFEQIMSASNGKQIVMFLDYDGTLSPIVDDPDSAFMSDTMRKAVRSVARYFPTAIVSGRCRDKVYNFVRLAELYYAGSHGMDIKGPAKGHKFTKAKTVLQTVGLVLPSSAPKVVPNCN